MATGYNSIHKARSLKSLQIMNLRANHYLKALWKEIFQPKRVADKKNLIIINRIHKMKKIKWILFPKISCPEKGIKLPTFNTYSIAIPRNQ